MGGTDFTIRCCIETMQSTFGSLYVNDFTLFGRNYQVNLQSEANFRERPDDLKQIFVRSSSDSMIPIAAGVAAVIWHVLGLVLPVVMVIVLARRGAAEALAGAEAPATALASPLS